MSVSVCTFAGPPGARYCVPCDYHRDGASKRSKCPGLCDRRGCRGLVDTRVVGARYCERHAKPGRAGRPVTTGSASTPVIAFRPGAALYATASAAAEREHVTVGELARRALVERLLA